MRSSPGSQATGAAWEVRLFAPLAGWALVAIGLWRLNHLIPPGWRMYAGPLTYLALFATTIGYVVLACRGGQFPRAATYMAIGAFACSFLVSVLLPPFGTVRLARSILLLAGAPVAGFWVARLVASRQYLVPVLLVAAVADAWSVFFGLSEILVRTGAVEHVAVSYPRVAAPDAAPAPLVGVTDWVFVAFLVLTVYRFGMPAWKLAPALVLGCTAGGVAVWGLGMPVPLLVTIGAAFVIAYFPEVRPSREIMRTTALFLLVLVAVLVTVGLTRRFLSPPEAPAEAPASSPDTWGPEEPSPADS